MILNIPELKLKFDTKVELRSLPHLFYRRCRCRFPIQVIHLLRIVLECGRGSRDAVGWTNVVVIVRERVSWLLGRLKQYGIGRLNRNVVVEIIKRCQEETI